MLRKAKGLLPLLLAQQKQNGLKQLIESPSLCTTFLISLLLNHRCLLRIQATEPELSAVMSLGQRASSSESTKLLNALVNYPGYKEDADPHQLHYRRKSNYHVPTEI